MGRYAKNTKLISAAAVIRLPMAKSTWGPECPVSGLLRYNTDTEEIEIFRKNRWRKVHSDDDIVKFKPTKDTFYGSSPNRTFGPMTFSYDPGDELFLLVFIQNVWQNPNVNFEVDGYYINFASPPPDQHTIIVIHGAV